MLYTTVLLSFFLEDREFTSRRRLPYSFQQTLLPCVFYLPSSHLRGGVTGKVTAQQMKRKAQEVEVFTNPVFLEDVLRRELRDCSSSEEKSSKPGQLKRSLLSLIQH